MHTPIQLSNEEIESLQHGKPLRLQINGLQDVVLVLAEQYERLKQRVDFADADPKGLYPLVADVFPDDWDDLSAYPNAERL